MNGWFELIGTTGSGWLTAAAAVVLLSAALWRQRRLRDEDRLQAAELAAGAEESTALRKLLRGERRRVRRSQRRERCAQRVVLMMRTLLGCRDAHELAERATRALVDTFGARHAALWTVGEEPCLLAETRAVTDEPPPPDRCREREVAIRDTGRRQVARLVIDFGPVRSLPLGWQAYAAGLGAALAVSDGAVAIERRASIAGEWEYGGNDIDGRPAAAASESVAVVEAVVAASTGHAGRAA